MLATFVDSGLLIALLGGRVTSDSPSALWMGGPTARDFPSMDSSSHSSVMVCAPYLAQWTTMSFD